MTYDLQIKGIKCEDECLIATVVITVNDPLGERTYTAHGHGITANEAISSAKEAAFEMLAIGEPRIND